VAGVCDAYINADGRRAVLFQWSGDVLSSAGVLAVTQASYTDLFPLNPPIVPVCATTGNSVQTLVIAAYAKVNAGTGQILVSSIQDATNATLSITATDYAWVTGLVSFQCEDLTVADGRRGSAWEAVNWQARKNTATTLTIGALAIVRTTAPL
jgi:hypothetical protein